jgi:hypothetical protein
MDITFQDAVKELKETGMSTLSELKVFASTPESWEWLYKYLTETMQFFSDKDYRIGEG